MGQYTYRVLQQIKSIEEIPDGATIYVDWGEHEAKTPDAAALTAAEEGPGAGDYRPISARHFNDVSIVPTTGLMVGERVAAEPEPSPAPVGDAPCAWPEGCGHAPGEHGTDGIGMCLVNGCPCEEYTAPPAAETLT